MKDDGGKAIPQKFPDHTTGVLSVEFMRSGKRYKEETINVFIPVNCVTYWKEQWEVANLVLRGNSLAAHGEFLVAIVLDFVSKVKENITAWAIYTGYRKDVKKLFEKDSKDEAGKSGEVSEYSVTLNESKAKVSSSTKGSVVMQQRKVQTTNGSRSNQNWVTFFAED